MTKEIKKWWEDNSSEFQKQHKIPLDVSYGPMMPNDDTLKLVGNVRGKKILEIGCGGAQCGIAFAKKGASVIGIDLSEEQLKYAEALAKKNKAKIKLIHGDIQTLKQIKSGSQDIVFSSWALFYIGDLKKCFREVYRVLKKRGLFVFSGIHPFWDCIEKRTMKVKKNYFKTGKYKEPYMKGMFVAFHNKISDYFNALIGAGFIVERVEEPDPMKTRKGLVKEIVPEKYKIKVMKLIPRTFIVRARKPKNA